jgi:anionic cell wall polymer biosynthesis LytR-Cps2A-Psr (LCP) family protein
LNILGLNGNPVGGVTKQIALSYNYGNGEKISCRNTLDAVSELLLGMKINHYASVTLDAVPVYNDLVRGVTLEVLDDFTGIDDTLVKGQTVTLMGQQALTYVRTREGLENDTNVARMVRQRQYLTALRQKTVEKLENDTQFAVDLTVKMSDYLISDRSVTQMQELLEKFSSYEFADILELQGESKVGEKFMEFYPDKDSIEDVVIKAFYQASDK